MIDGMAREASRVLMEQPEFVKDKRLYMDAIHESNWVESWRDRRIASRRPGVIISPAGMLKGGPAGSYLQMIGKKASNAVFLVGYQIPGTPGKELLEKGRCVIDGRMRKVKAKVGFFDFSSHAGASELRETVKKFRGNPTVYVVHGAEGNCPRLAKWIKDEAGLEAYAPNSGDSHAV
jgi:putative mRNA 3-end processing factor